MYLKNNSNREWLNYDLGGFKVDITSKSVIKVDQKEGELLLRNLGSENWLVEVEEADYEKAAKRYKVSNPIVSAKNAKEIKDAEKAEEKLGQKLEDMEAKLKKEKDSNKALKADLKVEQGENKNALKAIKELAEKLKDADELIAKLKKSKK